jgi:UDP-N-acetylmuramate dehydrogenase
VKNAQISRLRDRFHDRLRLDEPLAALTSFRIGGNADAFVAARSRQDIVDALTMAASLDLAWLVLGRGSNVLIDDAGFRGLIVRNEANLVTFDRRTGLVAGDSGARLPTVGAQTAKAGLAGFEWAVGIPGSLGGAVVMNAGAHGGSLSDNLVSADMLVRGNHELWTPDLFHHGYRSSLLQQQRDAIVLGATLQLTPGDATESLGKIQEFRAHRRDTQPTDPGAGSIFRNPPGHSSGALIDRAGLKGTRRGRAVISPKHGNFIVNAGGATSEDVLALIELARETVYRVFGVELVPEIEIIGPSGRLPSRRLPTIAESA